MIDNVKKQLEIYLPQNKNKNTYYQEWLDKSTQEVNSELVPLTNGVVKKNFTENSFNFGLNSADGLIGLGTASVNKITLNRLLSGVDKYFKETNSKKILISTSSDKKIILYHQTIQTLLSLDYEVKIFDTTISTEPTLSYAMKNNSYDFGIYLDVTESFFSLKILSSNGGFLSDDDYSHLYKLTDEIPFDFSNKREDEIKKVGIIKNVYSKQHYDEVKKILNKLNLGKIESSNKILINTRSEVMKNHLIKEISDDNIEVFLSSKGNIIENNDISSISSYSEIYKYANKGKFNFIINIDGTGSRISFAYKHNRTWNYLSSEQLFSLLLEKYNSIIKPSSHERVLTDLFTSNIVNQICKNRSLTLKRSDYVFSDKNKNTEFFAKGDSFYRYSFNSAINSSDSFISLGILLKYFDNKIEQTNMAKIISNLSNLNYFEIYWSKKIDSNVLKEVINYYTTTKLISDYDVKSISVIKNEGPIRIMKISISVGDIFIEYDKFKKTQYVYFNIYGINENETFNAKKDIFNNYKSISNGGYLKDESAISKKKLLNMIFPILLVATVLILVFTILFDPTSFSYAFLRIAQGSNEPFVYLLFIETIFRLVFSGFMIFITMRMYSAKIKFSTSLVAALLSAFVTSVSFTFLAGPAIIIWYLRKKGYRSSDITAALGVNVILFGVFYTILGLYSLFVGIPYIQSFSQYLTLYPYATIPVMAWIGFLWISFNVIIYSFLAMSKSIHNLIMKATEWLLFLIKKESFYKSIYEDLNYNIKKTRDNFKFIVKSPMKILKIFGLWILAVAFNIFSLSFAINAIANVPLNNYWQLVTLSPVFDYSNVYIPIPGSSGTTELLMSDVLQAFVESNPGNFVITPSISVEVIGDSITFLSRLSTYYLRIALTGIFFIGFIIKYNLGNKNVK